MDVEPSRVGDILYSGPLQVSESDSRLQTPDSRLLGNLHIFQTYYMASPLQNQG